MVFDYNSSRSDSLIYLEFSSTHTEGNLNSIIYSQILCSFTDTSLGSKPQLKNTCLQYNTKILEHFPFL